MSAHVLAKLGARASSNLVILNNPPIELQLVQLVLLADAMKVTLMLSLCF